jgi:hypothetical protein
MLTTLEAWLWKRVGVVLIRLSLFPRLRVWIIHRLDVLHKNRQGKSSRESEGSP